jgi:hypothetical protein
MNTHLTSEWISCGLAEEVSGRSRGAILRAARRGYIRTIVERGQPPRFSRRDVLAFAGILARD